MRKTKKDKKIFFAVRDYYGPGVSDDIPVAKIALHITGRKLMLMTPELKSDILKIKNNMMDSIYMESIT